MPRRKSSERAPPFLFNRRAASYDAWFEQAPGRFQFPGELAALRLLIRELPRPWLEVGVGTGRFGSPLTLDVGLDPSRSMLTLARKRSIPLVQGTGVQLPFKSASLGGVVLVTTLCFVSDPRALLKEIRLALKPHGGILVADILQESPWAKHYQQLGQAGHPTYRYARFYSLRELETLLEKADFRIAGRACSIVQPPTRVTQEEKGWWGYSQRASFGVLLAYKESAE